MIGALKDLYSMYGIYDKINQLIEMVGGFFDVMADINSLMAFRRELLNLMSVEQAKEFFMLGFMGVGVMVFLLYMAYYLYSITEFENFCYKFITKAFLFYFGYNTAKILLINLLIIKAIDPTVEILWELKYSNIMQ